MIYLVKNGPMQTTAAAVKVTTSASLATLLQILPLLNCKVREWGVSFDGSVAATPFECELIETGTIFATVTAFVTGGAIVPYDQEAIANGDPISGGTYPLFTAGTASSGYTSSAEGTIVATRTLDFQQVAPTNQWKSQLPLGALPIFQAGKAGRIRIWGDGATKAYCYMILEF
jgi:hypothetical protein